jgi:hypothetical protein
MNLDWVILVNGTLNSGKVSRADEGTQFLGCFYPRKWVSHISISRVEIHDLDAIEILPVLCSVVVSTEGMYTHNKTSQFPEMASALDFGSSEPQKTLVISGLRKRSLSLVAWLGLPGQSGTFDMIFWDPIPRYLPQIIFFESSLAEFGIRLVILSFGSRAGCGRTCIVLLFVM